MWLTVLEECRKSNQERKEQSNVPVASLSDVRRLGDQVLCMNMGTGEDCSIAEH